MTEFRWKGGGVNGDWAGGVVELEIKKGCHPRCVQEALDLAVEKKVEMEDFSFGCMDGRSNFYLSIACLF